MYALQKLVRVAPKMASVTTQQMNMTNIIAAKPRVRISFPEKVAHGVFMTVTALFTPFYCAYNFKNWRSANE